MKSHISVACLILTLISGACTAAAQAADPAALRLMLSEVRAGTMASEHYCTLVFADHRYHFEKANRKMGKDRERKVYEGELSETNWTALTEILDKKEFRELQVPQQVPPLVIENAHTFTISVGRNSKFQNMEFLDNKSRKPYETELKPLFEWWRVFRGMRMTESGVAPDPKCSLDSAHPVFSQ